jgi:hypothetical protein
VAGDTGPRPPPNELCDAFLFPRNTRHGWQAANDAKENVSPHFRFFGACRADLSAGALCIGGSVGEGWYFVCNKDFCDSLKQLAISIRIWLMKNTNTTIIALLFVLALFCAPAAPTAFGVDPQAPDSALPGGNTADGQLALGSLTTGLYNSAIGIYSLLSLTDGNFNTGVGAGTLLANTGNGNTATGAGALLSNNTGTDNTANGAFALFNNTASGNTAIGSRRS